MCRQPFLAVSLSLIGILNASVYAGSVGIAHYDVEIEVLPQSNAIRTRAVCTVRNDGAGERRFGASRGLAELAFDLLAREQRCKARTEVHGIWQNVSGPGKSSLVGDRSLCSERLERCRPWRAASPNDSE